MFFLYALASVLHISLACAAHHKHHHRALAQPSTATSTVTSSTVTRGVAFTIPTNPGSRVSIDLGIDGYATPETFFEYDTNWRSPVGIIEIGSPGQTIDVQFDTTFNGVLVRSTRENPADIDGSLVYNSSDSTSWGHMDNSVANPYTQQFQDGAYAVAFAGTETFNIGGTLYSNIGFGQLVQYNQNTSGQASPFGGARGIIGLSYDSLEPLRPNFMSAIAGQLTGTSNQVRQIKVLGTVFDVPSRVEMHP